MANRFPSQYEKYKDTRGAGGITIEGIELQVDEKGFIEAPVRLEETLGVHGFLRLNGAAYVAWENSLKKDATVAVSGVGAKTGTGGPK